MNKSGYSSNEQFWCSAPTSPGYVYSKNTTACKDNNDGHSNISAAMTTYTSPKSQSFSLLANKRGSFNFNFSKS